jgi:hypothetical protein
MGGVSGHRAMRMAMGVNHPAVVMRGDVVVVMHVHHGRRKTGSHE